MPETMQLSSPFEAFGETVTSVEIREPRGADYLELGEPRIYSRTPDGSIYAIHDMPVIKKYLERCVFKSDRRGERIPTVESFMSLADIRKATMVLLGFFSEEEKKSPS